MARRVLHGGCVGRSLSTNTLRGRRSTENLRGTRPRLNSITSIRGRSQITLGGIQVLRHHDFDLF